MEFDLKTNTINYTSNSFSSIFYKNSFECQKPIVEVPKEILESHKKSFELYDFDNSTLIKSYFCLDLALKTKLI